MRVEVHTPRGDETYTATLEKSLAPDELDTLYLGKFSTLDPGEYSFTCYTTLAGDTMINDNDTLTVIIKIKSPQPVPFYENVDDLDWDMGDWMSDGAGVWISRGEADGGRKEEENTYFSGMTGDRYDQFFYYDRKITGITERTGLYFDYRIMGGQEWPPAADTLKGDEKIHVIVARGCSYSFDTVFTIDKNNHVPDTLFRRMFVPLDEYAGDEIMVGFTTEWDSVWSTIHYDNILVADSIYHNHITGTSVCQGDGLTLPGPVAAGGVGPLSYRWEESNDSL